jgi:acyl-CoA synthetase (NDP forming)
LASLLDVRPFLAPRSIAVIGASDEPGNLGGTALRLLQKFPFPGEVHPVNPRRSEVAGLRCYPAVGEIPHPVELAIIAVAAERVTGLIPECARAGIGHAIVWAGGFAEVGGEGVARQAELEAACREHGVALLGPNCLGTISTALPLTATFASFLVEADSLLTGDISVVGQSGGLVTMAQALAQGRGFGFRHTVSTGNEAVAGAADFIAAYAADEGTRVIAAYVEGARDGAKLLAALRLARAAGKPVVILKGGSSAASAAAAAAHTGAFAGEARVWGAALREHAVQVSSLEELLDVSLHLSGTGGGVMPRGRRAVVVTFGGGSGVLSADQCEAAGLSTPALAGETRARLATLVPPTASIGNPVDLTPVVFNKDEWLARFPDVLDAMVSDPGTDAVLLQCGPMAHGANAIAGAIADVAERSPKSVCLAWPLAPAGIPELLRARGMHVFGEYQRAIRTVAKLAEYEAGSADSEAIESAPGFPWLTHVPSATPGEIVAEDACHRLLAAAAIPVAAAVLATSENEAVAAAEQIGWPVVLKGNSPVVTHRAAAGLIALGLGSEAEVRAAHHTLLSRAREASIELSGIYVQRMEDGFELLLSAFRDPTFGVVVSVGAGGVLTEALADVTLELAPVGPRRALEMLRRIRTVRGLEAHDGNLDLTAAAALISDFSRLAVTAPWRRFVLEVNPVKVNAQRAVAVDGLLIVEDPAPVQAVIRKET